MNEILENINKQHHSIEEGFSVLEIPNEIDNKKEQFSKIEKAEEFFEKLIKHFDEEENLFSLIENDFHLKDIINILRNDHTIILRQIENFKKIIYGNIFPLDNSSLKDINLVLSDINYLVMSHLIIEEKKLYPIIKPKNIIASKSYISNVNQEIKEVLEVLEILMRCEILLAKYYNLCAERWQEEKDFFLNIAKQEVHHFQNIKIMMNCIIRRPTSFVSNKVFKLQSAKLFLDGIEKNIEVILKNVLGRTNMVSIAYDYEKSIIENKYSNIVQTDDLEYNSLVREIERETKIHFDLIEAKFKEYSKNK